MRESLKQQLDESVPVDVTLTEMKKRQILKAAREAGGGRKVSRVPKVLPALAGVAVIGISGVLAYPYLIEDESNVPGEIRTGEENQVPVDGNNEEPELPVAGDEDVIEEDQEKDIEEDVEKEVEQTKDELDESLEDTIEEPDSPPLTKQEELYQLFNHEFFATGIELGDKVTEIESNYPNWVEKSEVEGGLLTNYGSFMIVYPYFEEEINYVVLRKFDQLTVSQIEKTIGQKIELDNFFDEINGWDVTSGNFILENKSYYVVTDSESEDALVKEIWISEYVEE